MDETKLFKKTIQCFVYLYRFRKSVQCFKKSNGLYQTNFFNHNGLLFDLKTVLVLFEIVGSTNIYETYQYPDIDSQLYSNVCV